MPTIVRGDAREPHHWGYAVGCHWCERIIQAPPGKDRESVERRYRRHLKTQHAEEEARPVKPMAELAAEIRAAVHKNCNKREHRCPCVCQCEEIVSCDCWSKFCTICHLHGEVRGEFGHGDPADYETFMANRTYYSRRWRGVIGE